MHNADEADEKMKARRIAVSNPRYQTIRADGSIVDFVPIAQERTENAYNLSFAPR